MRLYIGTGLFTKLKIRFYALELPRKKCVHRHDGRMADTIASKRGVGCPSRWAAPMTKTEKTITKMKVTAVKRIWVDGFFIEHKHLKSRTIWKWAQGDIVARYGNELSTCVDRGLWNEIKIRWNAGSS
jgi:hypothetical protein